MTGPQRDVSVVICAYTEQRWDDLVSAVASVRQQTIPPRQIIVVVDHNPALLARLRQEIPGVVAVENVQPRGISGARNSGIHAAHGSLIVFLDDDAVAAPDWLERLGERYADPEVMGVGGCIEPRWEKGRPRWFPEEFDWVVGCTYRGMPHSKGRVRNLIGANMSFRRQAFANLEGFRTSLGRNGTNPLGNDETELCIRLQQQRPDAILLYEPRARVDHRVPRSRATLRYFLARCRSEGLSKAAVSGIVGARDGLASELFFVLRVLPLGILRGLSDLFFGFDLHGLGRAAAIVLGLALAAAGYIEGRLSALGDRTRATRHPSVSSSQNLGRVP